MITVTQCINVNKLNLIEKCCLPASLSQAKVADSSGWECSWSLLLHSSPTRGFSIDMGAPFHGMRSDLLSCKHIGSSIENGLTKSIKADIIPGIGRACGLPHARTYTHTLKQTHTFVPFAPPFFCFSVLGWRKAIAFAGLPASLLWVFLFFIWVQKSGPWCPNSCVDLGGKEAWKRDEKKERQFSGPQRLSFSASFPLFNSLSLSSSLLSIPLFTSPLFSPSLSYFICPLSLTFCSSSPPICAFPASFILPLSLLLKQL